MLKTQASKLGLHALSLHVSKQFYPPPSGCVLYLPGYPPGEATTYDRSGQGNNGAITAATWQRMASGIWVLNFTGSAEKVVITDATSLNPTVWTLECWVRCASFASETLIIQKGATYGNPGYGLGHSAIAGKVRLNVGRTGGETIIDQVGVMTVNTWTHVAGVYDGTNSYILVNGATDGTGAPPSHTVSAELLYVGTNARNEAAFSHNGDIALVRIYNRALGSAELLSHFQHERYLFGV